jgi:hypothetical protein
LSRADDDRVERTHGVSRHGRASKFEPAASFF